MKYNEILKKHASSNSFLYAIVLYFASSVISLVIGISTFLQKCFNMEGSDRFFIIADLVISLLMFASLSLICYGLYSVYSHYSNRKRMSENDFCLIFIGHIAQFIVAFIVYVLFIIERSMNDTTLNLEIRELFLGIVFILALIFIPTALIDILIIRKALNHAIVFESGDYNKPIGKLIKPLVIFYIISGLFTSSNYFSNSNGFSFETLCSIISSILSLGANIMFASVLFAYTSDLNSKKNKKK